MVAIGQVNYLSTRGARRKKAFRRVRVASALYQDIQHVAILIHSPPEIVRFPIDLQVHAHPDAICPHTEGDDDASINNESLWVVLTRRFGAGKLEGGDPTREGKDHAKDPKDVYARI